MFLEGAILLHLFLVTLPVYKYFPTITKTTSTEKTARSPAAGFDSLAQETPLMTPGYCSPSTVVIVGYLISTARHSYSCARDLACSTAVT